jgi:AcrR family transcriptional regulator
MLKRGYHHGNLREALVEACLRLIAEKGPTGFTLSEAAREAGVTPAAVYRHFEGRDDLIAEAARQGYEMFADLLEHAWEKGQPSALASFEATGPCLLAFARKFPGHYVAMFESGISVQRTPELAGRPAVDGDHGTGRPRPQQHIPPEKRPAAGDVLGPCLGPVARGGGALRPGRPAPASPSRPRTCSRRGSGSICAAWA